VYILQTAISFYWFKMPTMLKQSKEVWKSCQLSELWSQSSIWPFKSTGKLLLSYLWNISSLLFFFVLCTVLWSAVAFWSGCF